MKVKYPWYAYLLLGVLFVGATFRQAYSDSVLLGVTAGAAAIVTLFLAGAVYIVAAIKAGRSPKLRLFRDLLEGDEDE